VPKKENPADILSRGCKVSKLQNTSWFTGPTFLKLEEHFWPQSLDKIETMDADLEKKQLSSAPSLKKTSLIKSCSSSNSLRFAGV